MHELQLDNVASAIRLLADIKCEYRNRPKFGIPFPAEELLTDTQKSQVIQTLTSINKLFQNIGLAQAVMAVHELHDLTDSGLMTNHLLAERLAELDRAIRRDMQSQLFMYIPIERAKWYLEPLADWGEIIARFPKILEDVEESSLCFACDRYAGAIFHILLVTEAGIIEFGDHIGVTDHRKGWGPTTKRAATILDTKYTDLSKEDRQRRPLVEQINPWIVGMQKAWRDKISHVDNKLVLLGSGFRPEVAKDIISATQAFMRRLAIDLPA